MHPVLDAIREAIQGTPYAGRVFLVGGAVRDWLLERRVPKDLDLVTEAGAEGLARLLYERGVSEIHPVTYPRFGTAMVQVLGHPVELVTARKESYRDESRKPDTEPATLLEDALRRDFTVNALLMGLESGEVVDPLGQGLSDLESRVLRTPLPPEATFSEDPLRMLRAVRLRWQLGFEPAPGLLAAIEAAAGRLAIVSFERIRDELTRMMLLPDPDGCLQDLAGLGLLGQVAPELLAMRGVTQGGYHHLDVWEHSLAAVRAAPPNLEVRLAVLLHDSGKPTTRAVDPDGRVRFLGHEAAGARTARLVLERWRLPGATVERVARLVGGHMRLCSANRLTSAGARRLIRDFPDDWGLLLQVIEADLAGMLPGTPRPDLAEVRRLLAETEAATPAAKLRSPLTGREIMDLLGMPEGPEVGAAKAYLTERVLAGDLAPDDAAAARAMLAAWKGPSSGPDPR
jgi:poly(A) polymerase